MSGLSSGLFGGTRRVYEISDISFSFRFIPLALSPIRCEAISSLNRFGVFILLALAMTQTETDSTNLKENSITIR